MLVDEVFGDRKRISASEFQRINEEVSSEMFLAIITLLHSSLPCSENFYRYKANYQSFETQKAAKEGRPMSANSPESKGKPSSSSQGSGEK